MNVSGAHEVVRAALADHEVEFVLERPEPFGSAGTLRYLKERIEGPVVTRNSDSLTDASVVDAIRTHQAAGTAATIVTIAVDHHADLLSEDDRAVRFIDRRTESVPGDMWLGISIFERDALELIGPGLPRDLASGLLMQLISLGEVALHRHNGYFTDVGTTGRYLSASLDLLAGKVPGLERAPGRVVEVDGGRAYVGPDARAAHDSLRAGAIVLRGAVVPDGTLVERAIVWPGGAVPLGTHVGDGVWAFGALQR